LSCAHLHRRTVADSEATGGLHKLVDAPVVLRADYAIRLRACFCCEEVEEQLRLARLNGLTVARWAIATGGEWSHCRWLNRLICS